MCSPLLCVLHHANISFLMSVTKYWGEKTGVYMKDLCCCIVTVTLFPPYAIILETNSDA